jgi:hypothetical protein
MIADLEFALPLNLQPPTTDAWRNGNGVTPVPMATRPVTIAPAIDRERATAATDVTGRWLIAGACVLLAGIAVAMGVTSFHAQFTYIFAAKRQLGPGSLSGICSVCRGIDRLGE